VIAPPGPGGLVAGVQQSVDLRLGEVGDQVAVSPLRWDGEHALHRRRVLWMLQGEVAEQRVDRGETVVAGGRTVVAVMLQVLNERSDQRRVELADVQFAWRLARALGSEAQQQTERGPVGGDRVRAGRALGDQPLGEVGLQGGGARAHRVCPKWACRRCAANCISSSEADRYQ